MDANVIGLRNLLEFYKNKKMSKAFFIFQQARFMEILIKKNIPTKETYRGNVSCTGPRACYDESKDLEKLSV